MKKILCSILIISALLGLSSKSLAKNDPNSLDIVVTAGKGEVTDWIVEKEIDLKSVWRIAGKSGLVDPRNISVIEITANSNEIGTVPYQIDPADIEGHYVLCWQIPGKLAVGQKRYFRVVFCSENSPRPQTGLLVEKTDANTVIKNGNVSLIHNEADGMIHYIEIDGVRSGEITYNDKAYDGVVHYPRKQKSGIKVSGPLRVVYEIETDYPDTESNLRVKYRFTNYAGQPVTHMEGYMTQDFSKAWLSNHFMEANMKNVGIHSYASDYGQGPLAGDGTYPGNIWAAVYGEQFLIGVINAHPRVCDSPPYFSYICPEAAALTMENNVRKCAFFWGNGAKDVQSLKRWNDAIANAPLLDVQFGILSEQVTKVSDELQTRTHTDRVLLGKDWADVYVLGLSQALINDAAAKLSYGMIGQASLSLEKAKAAIETGNEKTDIKVVGDVITGIVNGYPFLGNDKVAFVWNRPQSGCGLIAIHDKEKKHDFVNVSPGDASFWRVTTKTSANKGKTYSSSDMASLVTYKVDKSAKEASIVFCGTGNLKTRVEVRLKTMESLARCRIYVDSNSSDEGLVSVNFPNIVGIPPINKAGNDDIVLDTLNVGEQIPSPLATGKGFQRKYPLGLQFTALINKGIGLYLAEEDRQANTKTFAWSSVASTNSLTLSLEHPVLNCVAKELVAKYSSPGDVVIGPFHGDWYDASRIYRKWAITAPWCSKGPIAARKDQPDWFKKLPYWTLGHINSEELIKTQFDIQEFFDLPVSACQTYDWWSSRHQDNKYMDYFPPMLGSENFSKAIKNWQAKGIRVVPYVNGICWDLDTENYRTKNMEKEALRLKDGSIMAWDTYGIGQKLAGMCPGSSKWRKELSKVCEELVGKYHVDGIYFDFLIQHSVDCYAANHGHPIGGGNFWTKHTHDMLSEIRDNLKVIDQNVIIATESIAEFPIDCIDGFLGLRLQGSTPMYFAVYHGYAQVYGGAADENLSTDTIGRWWLMGGQNGWHNTEPQLVDKKYSESCYGPFYRNLLQCHYKFGTPYLSYGEMLRPPKVTGNDLPFFEKINTIVAYRVQAVEASAWKAPDGTIGVFILNYDEKNAHKIEWQIDLAENPGWTASDKIDLYQWTAQQNLQHVATENGGLLKLEQTIAPMEVLAFKLQPVNISKTK